MSRAENRRAEREGKALVSVVDDAMGGANGMGTSLVAMSWSTAWPYYGNTDAVQDNSIAWDPKAVVTQPRKKVAIIGFTPSRAQAPYTDPEYEIWGENALFVHKDVPRCTRWFDLHDPAIIDDSRLNWYREINVPVFLQKVREDVPGSVEFPKQAIEAEFGDYFTNTISWMIAFAIWEGFEVIDVYGVDMGQDTEYMTQRPNVEYFLGICKGRGIEFMIPQTSDLLKSTHQYGYGTDNGYRAKLLERRKEFQERLDNFAKIIEQKRAEIQQLKVECGVLTGAIQTTDWSINSWSVADHTSMSPDLSEIAPEYASNTVEVVDMGDVEKKVEQLPHPAVVAEAPTRPHDGEG